jgi:LysR family transcriptional regulator for metE and metH
MELEIRHLRLIQAVAEEGSVTRAGNRLHLTQSALSHQLRDAEERLGAPLFLRLNRKMIPTPAGERLLRSAQAILEELERAEREVRKSPQAPGGVLRVATSCYTCYHWLPQRLRRLHARFPGVDVRIVLEATRQPVEFLLEGRLDLAILDEKVRNRSIALRPIFSDELLLIMAPDHPLASRPFIRPEDFSGHNLIHYVPKEESSMIQRELIPAGYIPKRVLFVPLTEAIVEMVRAGLGVSVQARWAVEPHLETQRLAARPLSKQGFHRQWYVASLKSQATPAYVREFVKLLAEDPAVATAA